MFSSSVWLFLVLVVVFLPPGTYGTISDLRLCADPECRSPLSSGVATLRYMSIEPYVLSFNLGDEITIFSKEAGQNKELWGAEVRGKRGYIPKRLFKEMRVFVRNPSYTVATELIQPSMMQQMNNGQASSVLPQQQQPPPQLQQQQQPPPPLQQHQQPPVVSNGNYMPYQQQQQHQQQLPPHLNPMPHANSNNFPSNGNMNGMQVPMQQQMPMQPPALLPPPPTTTTTTTTSTTSTQAPTTTTAETLPEEQTNEYLNLANESLPNLSEPSLSDLAEEKAVGDAPPNLNVKEEENEGESADEEDDGEGDEVGEDEDDEEEEEASPKMEAEIDKSDAQVEEKLQPTDISSLDPTVAGESIELKKYPFEPVIESFDLPGLDHHTPISQLRSRSLEQGMETPLIVSETVSTEEALNTTGTDPVTIVEEEIAIKPTAEPLNDEGQVLLASKELTTNSTSLPAEVNENATVDSSFEEKLNDTGIVESIALMDVDLKREEVTVGAEQPSMEQVEEINPLPIEAAENEDPKNASLDQPTANVSTQEPTPNEEVDNLLTAVEPGKPIEEETVLAQETPSMEPEVTVIKTAQTTIDSTGDSLMDKVETREDSSSTVPVAHETKDAELESAPDAAESSGGGLLDSALNWLGISDIDELAKEEATDPSSELLQEIAGLNPNLNRESTSDSQNKPQQQDEQEQQLQQPIVQVPIDGFCHSSSDDCGNIAPPAAPLEEIAPPAIPIEEIAPPSGPSVVHVHSTNDDGGGGGDDHHHHHDHPPQQQQHHHDDGAGCGHGHSHIPGYIPGFGHHYKKPAAAAQQQQQAPPPVEEKEEHEYMTANPPPYEPIGNDPSVASSQPVEQVPSEIPSPPDESSSSSSSIPDYIPVEEIFRAEMEKRKLLLQQEQSESSSSEEGVISWLNSAFHTYIPFLHDVEVGSSGASVLYPAVLVVAVVLFLSLHYLIQGRSQEKWLKAKISQLDAQLYETQAAKEECSTIQTQLTEYEKEAAELRNRVDQADIDKVALSRRVADLEQERERLEKEVETTTEAATEANRMFEDLLNSQSETDELQHSVETLQQKLTQQQLAIETLTASLSIKAAENETLTKETDELRSETERYKVRVKTLQSDLEAMKTSNRNYQQKASQEGAELLKLKQEKDSWVSERRSLTGQVNSKTKEANEWRDKVENLKKAIKAKENDLAKSIELLKQSGGAASGIDSQAIIQLSSIVQLESDLAEANAKVEALVEEVKAHSEQAQQFEAEKQALRQELEQLQNSTQAAAKEKLEAETRLQVLSNYFKEKETQLQKELGTHEAKRAMTEENVSESVKRILESEENLTRYKSQVESLTKEIEEQERSYKSRLAAQEKRAHDNWVQSRQLERRLEESKQEATQLRHRLTQAEKEKEALVLAGVKENGTTTTTNGELDLIKPLIKRPTALGLGNGNADDLSAMMDHPAMLSPPIAVPPPPPGMELGMGVVPPPPPGIPGMAFEFCPPPDFIPPAPFMPLDAGLHSLPPMHMHHMPSIPPPPPGHLADHHRLPPLGMIAPGSFDVDYQPPPPRRYPSPPRRYPSPLGSERSVRSDRSHRMDRYDDEDHFRPVSPYGRHGGRPRSVGRSRDASPERPRSYSPLPSPLYPPHTTINSPDDWEDGRSYNRPPMMRSGSLRNPPQGPKTSSPLIQPMDNGDRQFSNYNNNNNNRR